ncbi:MAG: hypothetical protein WCT32_03025 [Patescibacteria group bacterium]|jgi:hypothetical protein
MIAQLHANASLEINQFIQTDPLAISVSLLRVASQLTGKLTDPLAIVPHMLFLGLNHKLSDILAYLVLG